MSKDSNFFTGQPVFKQIVNLIDRQMVRRHASEAQADRYTKWFYTYQHLIAMLYGTLSGCNSLRELVLGFLVRADRLGHLGISSKISRSTLADANIRRPSSVFAAIYFSLYVQYRHFLPDSRQPVKNLHAYDSTTITLFNDVFKGCCKEYESGAMNGKRKGGIKAHSLMKVSEGIPCLVCLDAAATSDSKYMRKLLCLEPGSMVAIDKGYSSHAVFEELSEAGIFYTTRLKSNVKYEVESEIPCGKNTSRIIREEHILLSLPGKKKKKHRARRIEYICPESGKKFVFLTNNFKLKAITIARIYKKRWGIELLFKQIKQNFQLKYFYGDSANAIEIQIWCVLIACLLMTVFQEMSKSKMAFSNMMFVMRCVLMEYVQLSLMLVEPERVLAKMLKKHKWANAPPTLFD